MLDAPSEQGYNQGMIKLSPDMEEELTRRASDSNLPVDVLLMKALNALDIQDNHPYALEASIEAEVLLGLEGEVIALDADEWARIRQECAQVGRARPSA